MVGLNKPTKIVHPATTLSQKQIAVMKNSKLSTIDVYRNGFVTLAKYCNIHYQNRALPVVDIGAHGSGVGHDEFIGDAMQFYALVLLYIATKDDRYANTAIGILGAWQNTLREFKGSNAPLEMAWGATCFVRGCELLKHLFSKWNKTNEQSFGKFLDKFVIPVLKFRYEEIKRWNNNWILTIQEALIQIALYRDDIDELNRLIEEHLKAMTICIKHDGSCTETCRDIIHSQFQIASMIQVAEMCWHQGVDVYSSYNDCLRTCMEYHASILNGEVPSGRKKEELKDVWFMPSAWEIGYNHYVKRKKQLMSSTSRLLNSKTNRPEKASFNWGPSWMFYESG
jgi:hypothetical protein